MKHINLSLFIFYFFSTITAKPLSHRNKALYLTYKAIPCIDQKINNLYQTMLKKTNLSKKTNLFESPKLSLYNQPAAAIYDTTTQTLIINKTIWKTLSPLEEKFILFHELRHLMQLSEKNKSVWKKLYNLTMTKKITFEQALEHEADQFAITQATKNCPKCLQELKKIADSKKPQNYHGYFTKRDFAPLIKKAMQNPSYCNIHKK